jgi:hypothetical protein
VLPGLVHFLKNLLRFDTDPSNAAVLDAIETVVDNSSPKIRLIAGYKKKLKRPVELALDHIEKLIETIPGPMDVTARSSVNDLLAKAFFVNDEQLETTVANDPDLKDFFAREKGQIFFILLTMDRDVKTYFGSRLQGQIIVKDVALKSVDFSDHKFRAPSLTMDEAVRTVKSGALQVLAHQALEIILEEQSRKVELKQLKEELTAKLKMMAAERQQMVLKWEDASGRPTYKEAQDLLGAIEEELHAIKTRGLDLDRYLTPLLLVLNHPERYLSTESVAMRFDRMGVLVEEKPGDAAGKISIADVRFNFNQRRSALFLKCDRSTLTAP